MSGGTYRVLRAFNRGSTEVKVGEVVALEREPRDPSFFELIEQQPSEPAPDGAEAAPARKRKS